MAPGDSTEVIDLCDDEDDTPGTTNPAPTLLSSKTKDGRAPFGRPKRSTNVAIDLTRSPERHSSSQQSARDSHSSSQASGKGSRDDMATKSSSSRSTGNNRTGSSEKPWETSRKFADLLKSSTSQKRGREVGENSLENDRPHKRQRPPQKLERDVLLNPRDSPKSRAKTNLLSALNSKKAGSSQVVDLTSDGDVEEPLQKIKIPDARIRTSKAAASRPSDFIREDGSKKHTQKSIPHTNSTSPSSRFERQTKSPTSTIPPQSRSSPLRNKLAKANEIPSTTLETKGWSSAVESGRGPEIPESLPGTPEKDTAEGINQSVRKAVSSPGDADGLGDAQSPSNASKSRPDTAAVGTRTSAKSSPGSIPWQNFRSLPLTPSESSADEDARRTKKQKEVLNSPRPGSASKEVASLQSSLREQAANKGPLAPDVPSGKPSIALPNGRHTSNQKTGARVASRDASQKFQTSEPAFGGNKSSRMSGGGKIAESEVGTKNWPVPPKLSTSERVERVTGQCLDELQRDNEHWTRTLLQRARCSADSRKAVPNDEPTSVFSQMTPMPLRAHDKKKGGKGFAKFETEVPRSNGSRTKSVWIVPYTSFKTKDEDVPSYSHFVNLKHNFLAPNETSMQHWPYFDDDTNTEQPLASQFEELYDLDMAPRETKLLHMLKAEHFAEYSEYMLHNLDCEWFDVLRFLLEAAPDVGSSPEAKKALQNRDAFCDVQPFRKTKRWMEVLAKLPRAASESTGKAGILCEQFFKLAGLNLWHLARRSDYARSLLEDEVQNDSLAELTCRVCMRFSCPYHGEIENPEDDSHSETSSDKPDDPDKAVETDIINPPIVNSRSRIAFPASLNEPSLASKDRRSVHHWQSGANATLIHKPDERNPFYPCRHPGKPCSAPDADCSCYANRIPCEKSCACPPTCSRKFQGCNCSQAKTSKRRLCADDDNCACFQLGRECDPDLCGDCGVCDVLDPKHRHDDRILTGRCHAASIQRSHPRHTMIGKSEFHGFGLYACEDIREHDFIGEYKGELITSREAERRGAIYEHQKLSYLFSLNQSQEVDSTFFGNKMRFINHATKSKCNLYARIVMVNTVHRIGLYASRDVAAGEELAFNYGPRFTFAEDQKGGKHGEKIPDQGSKAAPHVRNANITKTFWDPDLDGDDRRTGTGQRSLGQSSKFNQHDRRGVRRGAGQTRGIQQASSDLEIGEAEDDTDDYMMEDMEEEEDDLYS